MHTDAKTQPLQSHIDQYINEDLQLDLDVTGMVKQLAAKFKVMKFGEEETRDNTD